MSLANAGFSFPSGMPLIFLPLLLGAMLHKQDRHINIGQNLLLASVDFLALFFILGRKIFTYIYDDKGFLGRCPL